MNRAIMFAAVMIYFLVFSAAAYGYIDPGAGSIMTQLIIAAVVTALFVIRMKFRSIKVAVRKLLFFKRK